MSNSTFRIVGAGITFLSPTDFFIQVDTSSGSVQIVLPKTQTILENQNNSNTPYNYVGVRFVDISGNASVNNITFTGFETDVINGSTNIVLNTDDVGGFFTLIGIGQWAYQQNSNVSDEVIIQIGSGVQSSVRVDNLNTASGIYSTTLGACNSADSDFDTIGGGLNNSLSSCNGSTSSCAILYCNTSGTIGGGRCNSVINCISPSTLGFTIAVGNNTISGGYCNLAGQTASTYDFTGLISIGGGEENVATGFLSTISGGGTNTISALYGTIGGGYFNVITGCLSVISGGSSNTISAENSVISGGDSNVITASGCFSSIGGGLSHSISGAFSSILGGFNNTISGGSVSSTILGGDNNTISNSYSGILSGLNNTISGKYSSIVGGCNNTISGSYSAILGGINNVISNTKSFVIGVGITTNRDDATFVRNLSITNIPITAPAESGSVWSNGGVLTIVP